MNKSELFEPSSPYPLPDVTKVAKHRTLFNGPQTRYLQKPYSDIIRLRTSQKVQMQKNNISFTNLLADMFEMAILWCTCQLLASPPRLSASLAGCFFKEFLFDFLYVPFLRCPKTVCIKVSFMP